MTGDSPEKGCSKHKSVHYNWRSQLKQMAAGACSSIVTRCVCQPFEVLKIRFQLQVEPLQEIYDVDAKVKSKYTSFQQACRLIYKEEGITAFWKGHNAGQLLSIVYGTAQFWAYEQIKLELSQSQLFHDRPNFNRFVSGGASGAVATLFSMPFDVIRTRLVSQDHGSGYRNTTTAIPHIIRVEGVRGLYRGMGTMLLQIGPLVGANFAFYGILNDFGAKFWHVEQHKDLPTWFILTTGGLSGTLSKMAVYPLDFIKRRLQIQGFQNYRQTYGKNTTCRGIGECVRLTLRDEGYLGFYKGMSPTLVKAAVSTALYFAVYEKIKPILMGSN